MKICYICYFASPKAFGIGKKVASKIRLLNKANVSAQGIFLFDSSHNYLQHSNTSLIPINGLNDLISENPSKGYQLLFESISNNIKNLDFDLIILRYPWANQHLLNFLQAHPNTILEHNTKEEEELDMFLKNISWRDKIYLLRKGQIKTLNKARFDKSNENRFKRQCLQAALAGICVTDEISDYEKELSGGEYKTFTISNGIDVEKIKQKTANAFDGSQLRLIMVNSSPTKWHGVDRLLQGLKNNSKKHPIHLDIIGNIMPQLKKRILHLGLDDQVTLHGYKTGKELDVMFDNSHIGVGTLALHRINLKQGAVLKVREYLARGLPFFIGYEDVDLYKNDNLKPFYHQYPANDSALDLGALWEFANSVYQIAHCEDKIRNLAFKTVDYSKKMDDLILILTELSKK